MGPFGPILRFPLLEISRSLDCLVRIAVLREAVSLEIPCNYWVYGAARLLPALSMSYSGHFWMAWPLWGVQRAGNLQGIAQGIFVAEPDQYGLNLVQRGGTPAPVRSTDSFWQPG